MTEKTAAQTGTAPGPHPSNGMIETKASDGNIAGKNDPNAKDNAQMSPALKPDNAAAAGARASPKKRRKVNHGKNIHPSKAGAAVPYVCLSATTSRPRC
ncbi:hypothetical protein BJX63DRAFT_312249 [Aspergillus granulosus]|uniref:Uncharacterized protein n=1 Tax=Aspergillus granulosus TaxID=176169 RepID=A0ABR4HY73_9EURO